jgi:hypothetical protein
MPNWLNDVLKTLGISPTPFICAVAAYSFFLYLDNEASDPAKKAFAAWFKPLPYDKRTVADAVIEMFDRLYTRPLLGWRAFLRSTLFSVVLALVFLYQVSTSSEIVEMWSEKATGIPLLGSFMFNILADYISLFVIRRWLVRVGERTVLALLTVPIIGAIAIFVLYLARIVTGALFFMLSDEAAIAYGLMSYIFFIPAIAVHLWLPLFALCVLLIQAFNYFARAVGWTQWFLKQGAQHPLRAVGYVAAVIVFFGTVIGQAIVG